MWRKFCLLTVFLSLVAMAFFAVAATNSATEHVQRPDSLDGGLLFQNKCSMCHGSEGVGSVGVPLNLPDFLRTASDNYLYKTIRLGRPGRVMPSFQTLTDEQVNSIIRYIRSWQPEIKTPVYSSESIVGNKQKGKQIFDASCASCHRQAGIGGKGTGVTFSRPRDAEIIAPAIGNPTFLASASDHMIKQVIMTGRDSTPMISAKLMGLTEQDVDHVVSYLRSLADTNKVQVSSEPKGEPVLEFESSYTLEETINNIREAAMGYNFRYIREQTLDRGFVDEGKESNDAYLVYFCNFTFLNQVLQVDPRVGMFLPFRATILKKGDTVVVMTVNPDFLCSLFNNDELKQGCAFMSEKYAAMLEESTL